MEQLPTKSDDIEKSECSKRLVPVRVKPKTQVLLISLTDRANSKSMGTKIKRDDLIYLELTMIDAASIKVLQDQSLTNADKMELMFRKYQKNHGAVTKDDFLGQLMRGEIDKVDTFFETDASC